MRLSELWRRLGAQNVLRTARLAKRAGLAPSDLECLDLLFLDGPMSPGALMAGTGLSSSSVTAMVDRLARRGLVARSHDPEDGRRVLVSVDLKAIKPIQAMFQESSVVWNQIVGAFEAEEVAVVERFMTLMLEASQSDPL